MAAVGPFGLGPVELLIVIVLLAWPGEIWSAVRKAQAKGRSPVFWGIIVGILGPLWGLVPLLVLLALPRAALPKSEAPAESMQHSVMQH